MSLVVLDQDVVGDPFLELEAADHCLPQLLVAVSNLGKYVPIKAIVNDHIVTGLIMTAKSVMIQGQPIRRGR